MLHDGELFGRDAGGAVEWFRYRFGDGGGLVGVRAAAGVFPALAAELPGYVCGWLYGHVRGGVAVLVLLGRVRGVCAALNMLVVAGAAELWGDERLVLPFTFVAGAVLGHSGPLGLSVGYRYWGCGCC